MICLRSFSLACGCCEFSFMWMGSKAGHFLSGDLRVLWPSMKLAETSMKILDSVQLYSALWSTTRIRSEFHGVDLRR
jgi:hypothetical protein